MKKALLVLTLVLIIGVTATFAYAQVSSPESGINYEAWKDWFKRKMEWRRSQIDRAQDEGLITKDEAELWNKHLDYMERFHEENGFMPGICHGGYGWNKRNGFRRGMMRGLAGVDRIE
ncbi:MAG: hypothetical protein GXY88_00045 [Tissierellia bacterium]|nr:hypothetical protein [Tissierellia bacterium]